MFLFLLNGPLSSCLKPHFQNEIKVKAIHMKMFFNSHAGKTDFHKKNFALGLDLKARVFGTRNWPTNKRSHFLLRGREREREGFLYIINGQCLLIIYFGDRFCRVHKIIFYQPVDPKKPCCRHICWNNCFIYR